MQAMAKTTFRRIPKSLGTGVAIGLAFLALIAVAAYFMGRTGAQDRGPLDPGVRVRDTGSARSKCYSCENQAGVQGTVGKCLTCQQPSFKYLTETIVATQEAKAQGVTTGCRGCA